jgi:hypothetical protein
MLSHNLPSVTGQVEDEESCYIEGCNFRAKFYQSFDSLTAKTDEANLQTADE